MIAQIDSLYFKTRPRKAGVRLLSHLLFQGRFATTRFRWLNPLILAHLRLASQLPSLRRVSRPIFIVGTGRSGSTILGKVMSMHRDIAFLNEPKALWYIVDRHDDVNGHFGSDAAKYRFSIDDATPAKRKIAHRLYGYYLFLSRSRRVLDKNPEMLFRAQFVQTIFPDARFIFLVRNGWDTVRSIKTWSEHARIQVDSGNQDWWGIDRRKWRLLVNELVTTEPMLAPFQHEIEQIGDEVAMAAVEWVVTMQEGLRLFESAPGSVHKLHYEELTSCPEQCLLSLLDFCELPHDRAFLDYGKELLKPNVAKKPPTLPWFLDGPFDKTMAALGY